MALVAVQYDLFFIDGAQQGIWQQARKQAAARRPFVRWLDRNMDRLNRAVLMDRTLWLPYVHIAAYYRWTMPKVARAAIWDRDSAEYPVQLLDDWRRFLRKEIPDLLSRDDALLSLCKLVLYRNFDASKEPGERLHGILMSRYGFECVSETVWAEDVRHRVRTPNDSPTATNQRGLNA